MTVKRYDQFGDEALADSWPVYVLASDYDDLLAERALIVTRAENAEAALEGADRLTNNAWARLAEAETLLREARPVTLALLEIIRDASVFLPKRIAVKLLTKLDAATDRLLKWCGGIDAHLARKP